MSLTDDERKVIVSLELEKSHTIIEQIPELQKLAYWDNVANRLYYAVFHSVCALLINDGYSVSSHKGAVSLFGQHYVVTGKMSQQVGRLYSQLQTIREKSDYNCSYTATKEDIEPLIDRTRDFINRIEALIK